MPIIITMPALSPTMTEGILSNWLVKEGDSVVAGDILAEIETDKATMEVEAIDDGIIGKIIVEANAGNVSVNAPIAVLLESGETVKDIDMSKLGSDQTKGEAAPSEQADAAPPPAPSEHATVPAAAPPPTASPPSNKPEELKVITGARTTDRVFASPLARRIAARQGMDLKLIKGTGPRGRVVKKDIELAASRKPAISPQKPSNVGLTVKDPIFQLLPSYELEPITRIRRTVAQRLTASARDIPHFNLQVDVVIDDLLKLYKKIKLSDNIQHKVTINDFIIKAVACALGQHPDVNVAFTDEGITKFNQVDISVAVATEAGLITPIVRNASGKGLTQISQEVKDLVQRAHGGKLKPNEYQGGTFSISNLGMFGVKVFNSIINPPQSAILSVGAGEQRALIKEGVVTAATVMSLTLAVDHRSIDGAVAAKFVQSLKSFIEDPFTLLL